MVTLEKMIDLEKDWKKKPGEHSGVTGTTLWSDFLTGVNHTQLTNCTKCDLTDLCGILLSKRRLR